MVQNIRQISFLGGNVLYTTKFSVWLIPAMPYQRDLQTHINALALQYDAPPFMPHVTLFCGGTNDIEKTLETLENIFKNIPKINLTA